MTAPASPPQRAADHEARRDPEPGPADGDAERPDHRRQRQHRADPEVDTAGQDHEELADRQDADDRRLVEDVDEILRREEDRADHRSDHDQHRQKDPGAVVQGDGAQRHAAREAAGRGGVGGHCKAPWTATPEPGTA